MYRVTGIQSQLESYQRPPKWYLMPPCLTYSIIRYGLRVSGAIQGKGVASSATPRCSNYWKGSLRVALNDGRLTYLSICIRHRSVNISQNFYNLWIKRFSHIRKRDAQSFYDDFSICPPYQGLGEQAKVNLLLPRQEFNSLTFLKSQPTLPVHDITHHLVSIPIWDFYFDISE